MISWAKPWLFHQEKPQISNSLRSGDIKLNSWALIMIPVVHRLQIWNLKSLYDDVQAKQPGGCYRSPAEWRVSTVCHCYCSLCLQGNLAPPSSRVILPLLLFTLLHLDLDQDPDHLDGPFALLQHSFVIFILCSKQPGTVIFSFFFLCFILRFW